jgi:hypothetical protein
VTPEQILNRLIKLASDLPEIEVESMFGHAKFHVRRRTVAYFLNNHHDDGIVGLAVKVDLGENLDMVHLEPDRYYRPAYIGSRGWLGIRLDRPEINWADVSERIHRSYALVAPRSLARRLSEGQLPAS